MCKLHARRRCAVAWWDETGSVLGELADRVGPSVVGVSQRGTAGSGVVMEPGKVLTNAHNLRGDSVDVAFPGGATAKGRVVGADVDGDLGVVAVETGGRPALQPSPAAGSLSLGAPVFALSNPGGMGLRVSLGFVSGTERSFRGPRGRRISGGTEHTAPLLPGSSGGPIVDASGALLGINTNRLGEGFYLALPADEDLWARAAALGRGEAPSRPRLGIGVAPADMARRLRRAVGLPEVDGLLVRHVDEDGPAGRAGIAEGDLIVGVDGRPVTEADDLHDALGAAPEGSVTIAVVRGTEERSVSISRGAPAA
jgi:serine protease Do